MRIVVVHPGPSWSVADVANGWTKAFKELGHDVAIYDLGPRIDFYSHAHLPQSDGTWKRALSDDLALAAAYETVPTTVFGMDPDLIVFVSAFWLPIEMIDTLRSHGHRCVLLGTESPYEDDRHEYLAPHFDAVILNDPTNIERVAKECPVTFYAPHSYDPEIHKPGPARADLASDVCMIGTGYPTRVRWLELADLEGLDVCLLGNWLALADEHPLGKYVRQPRRNHCIDNPNAVGYYQSTRSSLNVYRRESNEPGLGHGWSMGPREIELAACGTFYLTEERGENRAVLPMVPTVDSPQEYREILDWWLTNDAARDRVVLEAREAIADWTFAHRAARLLWLLDRQPVTA